MSIFIISILIIMMKFTTAYTKVSENYNSSLERNAKFFPIFTIIRFPNSECGGTSNFNGTCFTRRECNDLKGLSIGTCASKRGVCCVVQKSCGGISNVNNTYFTNTGYPGSFMGGVQCSMTINRCNSDICQLRLDILESTLAQPNAEGNCNTDYLTVTGGSSRVPRMCGDNSAQHVYVNFNGNNPIIITIGTNSGITLNRRWNIRITQLACNCPSIAPSGCLMYHNGVTGSIQSFNYGVTTNPAILSPPIIGTRELANLNYGVCIRMEANYCSIRWTQANNNSFSMTGFAEDTIALWGTDCTTDFVVIPHPYYSNGNQVNSDRFCGTLFNTVTTSSKPFVLTVVTDQNEQLNAMLPPDSGNRGFILNYEQISCNP